MIEELFLSLGYNVFRYGMENSIPGIMNLLGNKKGRVQKRIREIPDFVIQNKKSKKVFFIEVKFRANEVLTENSIKFKDYTDCYIVLVSKKHISCVAYEEFKMRDQTIFLKPENYLGNRSEFCLSKDLVRDFCYLAKKYFKCV